MVYVASSVRELPAEAHDWLSRPEVKAAASASIYEAMAMLGQRRRPRVLIVFIEQVDWSEMEFFELAGRMSPTTRVYVTGPELQQAKLEAAVARGAHLFDIAAIEEYLQHAGLASPAMNTDEVLHQTILSIQPTPAEPAGPPSPEAARPAPPPPPEVVAIPPADVSVESRPVMRLVSDATAEESETECPSPEPVPFPWSPSPNRPKRTPPPAQAAPAPASPQPRRLSAEARGSSVELTAEELTALVGKVNPPPAREDRDS